MPKEPLRIGNYEIRVYELDRYEAADYSDTPYKLVVTRAKVKGAHVPGPEDEAFLKRLKDMLNNEDEHHYLRNDLPLCCGSFDGEPPNHLFVKAPPGNPEYLETAVKYWADQYTLENAEKETKALLEKHIPPFGKRDPDFVRNHAIAMVAERVGDIIGNMSRELRVKQPAPAEAERKLKEKTDLIKKVFQNPKSELAQVFEQMNPDDADRARYHLIKDTSCIARRVFQELRNPDAPATAVGV